jgi:hypothetical protein
MMKRWIVYRSDCGTLDNVSVHLTRAAAQCEAQRLTETTNQPHCYVEQAAPAAVPALCRSLESRRLN